MDLVADKLPQHFTISPQDIQVLCPGKKNVAGMTDLNLRLQERLKPPTADKPQHYHGGTAFRLGDRVQQVRNNAHRGESGVFNGTGGIITAVESDTHHLTVTCDDGEHAAYPFADLDELAHAYALTVTVAFRAASVLAHGIACAVHRGGERRLVAAPFALGGRPGRG